MMQGCCSAQVAFTLRALLGQNMTTVGLRAFERTRASLTEPLGGTAIGFDFWHFRSPMKGIHDPLVT
jgi:hypothetical protein